MPQYINENEKDQGVSMKVLERICSVVYIDFGESVESYPDEER